MMKDIAAVGAKTEELQTELIRKTIHLMIALVPTIASFNLTATLLLVGAGTLFYAVAETLRISGRKVLLVSHITFRASRRRDDGRFVMGPVTLGLGAMLALLFYPEPAAAVAIYALAFGDGFASLVGKLFPYGRMDMFGGKTLSGSFACFAAVFFSSFTVTSRWDMAFFIALIATLLEVLPWGDMDNIVIPVGTGLAVTMMIGG